MNATVAAPVVSMAMLLGGVTTVTLCALPLAAGAQTHAPGEPAPEIAVTPSFGSDAWVASDAPLALRLSRPLAPTRGASRSSSGRWITARCSG